MTPIFGKKADKRLKELVKKTVERIMKRGLPEKDVKAILCNRGNCDFNWSGECEHQTVTTDSDGLCADFKEF